MSSTGNNASGWVMYIDSDAVFRDPATSIQEYLARNRSDEFGKPSPNAASESAVMFFRNNPGVSMTPNAGTFLIRPGANATELFRFWWAAGPDVGGSHEQQSLFTFYSHPRWAGLVSVIASERFCGLDDTAGQWVRHYCGQHDALLRSNKLRAILNETGIDKSLFLKAIAEVSRSHVVDLDVFEADAQIVASVDPSGLGCAL